MGSRRTQLAAPLFVLCAMFQGFAAENLSAGTFAQRHEGKAAKSEGVPRARRGAQLLGDVVRSMQGRNADAPNVGRGDQNSNQDEELRLQTSGDVPDQPRTRRHSSLYSTESGRTRFPDRLLLRGDAFRLKPLCF